LRTGIVGHISAYQPPMGEPNPGRWVLDQIESPDDWALIVGNGAISIGFSNATEFEADLRRHAGMEVDLHGLWVGEELEIIHISEPAGGGHQH
jgi:hypothetical protein